MKSIICAVLLLLMILSCKKDSIPTTYVPSWLKQLVPYRNAQLVTFRRSSGETLQFTAKVESLFSVKSACAGCDQYQDEYIEYIINKDLNTQFIRVSIDHRPVMFLSVRSPERNYQQGQGYDIITADGTPQIICNSAQICLPTITLNGKVFNDVLEMDVAPHSPTAKDMVKIYYSVTKGVVGFIYTDGTTYNLED